MATGYSRQSTFIDGDVILAEHGNLEFDKLVNVFGESTGHNHDGTPGGGALVPLLKDTTGAQDFTLTATGVTGSVILDEDTLSSNSAIHLATQQSIKTYVDTNRSELNIVDQDLQDQIDVFDNSNHGHTNKAVLDQITQVDVDYLSVKQDLTLKVSSYTSARYDKAKVVATTAAVDITLPALTAGDVHVASNSLTSTEVVKVLNPSYTITAPAADVAAGTDIILEPGDTITLLALTASTMEVL